MKKLILLFILITSSIGCSDNKIYLNTKREEASKEKVSRHREATWHKTAPIDLEHKAVEQLKIDPSRIYDQKSRALPNNLNETIIVIAEIENEIVQEDAEEDYKLTSHILIVNSITGEIKNHFSEVSNASGWTSNAIFIEEISIEDNVYELTETETAFGVKVSFRSMSQPNPYGYTKLSLYIRENNSLKKVLDNLILDEYTGEVNVNTCYASYKTEQNELMVLTSSTDGYFDIQVKSTISQSVFETNSEGDCDDVEKSRSEKTSILKYNNTKYE